jgi:3-methylfumaryl-CoA hydratase
MAQDLNIDGLRQWIGRREVQSDRIVYVPIAALSATLDRDDPDAHDGDALPPLWHWLYFLPIHKRSELDLDGHVRRGGFLPPVGLPHRMFAGGTVKWHHPLCVGENITRDSRILDVTQKEGRSGQLVLVTVGHTISDSRGVALTEQLNIVYRDGKPRGESQAPAEIAPNSADWSQKIQPDEVLLFRFSALTFNGHRIHYDRPYAIKAGYPGLVVHGPLIAIFLLDLLRRRLPDATPTQFSFRAVKSLFDTDHFVLNGRMGKDAKTCILWAADSQGYLAMDASVTLA